MLAHRQDMTQDSTFEPRCDDRVTDGAPRARGPAGAVVGPSEEDVKPCVPPGHVPDEVVGEPEGEHRHEVPAAEDQELGEVEGGDVALHEQGGPRREVAPARQQLEGRLREGDEEEARRGRLA